MCIVIVLVEKLSWEAVGEMVEAEQLKAAAAPPKSN